MKPSTIIIAIMIGFAAGGVALAASASTPKLAKTPLERPGYTILPNCEGFKVSDETEAFEFAHKAGMDAPQDNWLIEVQQPIFGACGTYLGVDHFLSYDPATQKFIYNLLRASLRGGVEGGKIQDPQALSALAMVRSALSKAGVDVATWSTTYL